MSLNEFEGDELMIHKEMCHIMREVNINCFHRRRHRHDQHHG